MKSSILVSYILRNHCQDLLVWTTFTLLFSFELNSIDDITPVSTHAKAFHDIVDGKKMQLLLSQGTKNDQTDCSSGEENRTQTYRNKLSSGVYST